MSDRALTATELAAIADRLFEENEDDEEKLSRGLDAMEPGIRDELLLDEGRIGVGPAGDDFVGIDRAGRRGIDCGCRGEMRDLRT